MKKFAHYNSGKHRLDYARTINVERDILVLSLGPHIYSTSNLERVIQQVIAEHSAQLPQLRLIWRSQFPGGCGLSLLTMYRKDYLNSGREICAGMAFVDISPLYLRPRPYSHVGSMPGAKYSH